MPAHETYDVIVMGGGPAGATAAALVAEQGRRVLVVERLSAGDFKIGESLMPSTYWTLDRLGALDRMRATDFPRKHSVQFYSKSGKASRPFYFFEANDHESAVTWQVLRHEFDALLLTIAAEKGAEVLRGASVRDVLFDGDRATGVVVEEGGASHRLRSRVVVDATGQRALLARKLGLLETDPHLRHAAIFTHFEGGHRDQGIDEGATLVLHTEDAKAWFWYIPMPRDRVSVGVVGDVEHLISSRADLPHVTFWDEVRRCPAVRERLQGARQVREVSVLRDFSYRASRLAGPGWVLVGDAFSFIDPVYSSGVLLALKSGEMAADAIVDGLVSGDLGGEQLGRFGPELVAGMASVRSLVHAFYAQDFSFAKFLARYPEHQQDVIDILTGNIFDRDFDLLFEHMGEVCDLPALPPQAREATV
ncbi:MAG: NAD(P)/FAD-dependent oxidoreductase [Thermoanaerobaculia bacterium]|nr:NAD(P)/FAD-dependent oxidoreductase [Thermoanaerobaculia bacterium]